MTSAPLGIAQHLVDASQWRMPVLAGTVEAPTLRRSGTILQKPGYDRRARVYFDAGGASFPEIPDRPSRPEGVAALAVLAEVCKDFPFTFDEDGFNSSARSVALSAQLTGLVRRTLADAPLHAFDAPAAGSGKTKLTVIPAVLQTGREPTLMAQGPNIVEFNKALFSVLRTGDAAIAIDNVDREIESAMLCSVLTSPSYQDRVLGLSQMGTVSTNSLIMVNGTNLSFKGDITDRTIICRVDPGVEDPKSRVFDREPIRYALDNRAALVAAGLTALRSFAVAGYPGLHALKPSRFPDWDHVVRGALVWLGEPDPLTTGALLKELEPEKDDLRLLMSGWRQRLGDSVGYRARDVLAARDADSEGDSSDLATALDSILGSKHDEAKALGQYLKKVEGRIVDGYRFVSSLDKHTKTLWWRLAQL